MRLPFTHEQFLEVFAAYHRLFGPVAAALWVATLGVLLFWWRKGPPASPALAGLLAFHWVWSGLAYHLAVFRSVNPAAGLFGILFVAQSLLFLRQGVLRRELVFTRSSRGWGAVALALVAYAMLYPAVGLLSGLRYPGMPTFGVPCPTTILTLGLLLCLPRRGAWLTALVPLLWSAIGGSAAFALGIRPDLALPVAGALVLARLFVPSPRTVTPRPPC